MSTTISWRAQRRRRTWLKAGLRGLVLLLFILPLLRTLLAFFGLRPNNATAPPTWSWPPVLANYAEIGVADPGFIHKLITSLSVSALATLLTTVIAYLAAYSLGRSVSGDEQS